MFKGDQGPKNNLNDDNSGSLFSQEPSRGEWYFNNPGLKSQGSQAFKNKWGTRENTDNWRRSAGQNGASIPKADADNPPADDEEGPTDEALTEESLLANLPLNNDAIEASNAKKALACRQLAITYKDKLGNCAEAVKWNEMTLLLTKDSSVMEPALFDLAYCYKKLGMSEKAKEKENQLASMFPNGKLIGMLLNPKSKNTAVSETDLAATREYQRIYDLFLAGRFDEALKAKQNADAIHPNSQWTPQLLYIESVYYIKARKDSLALSTLNKIPALFPGSPLAEKAGIMADVVFRRAEIENELAQMQVVRQKEDSIIWIDDRPAAKPREERIVRASATEKTSPKPIAAPAIKDSIIFKAVIPVDTVSRQKEIFTFIPNETHIVLMMMQNIDVVYVNEAKRALTRYHAINFSGSELPLVVENLGKQQAILISGFASATDALAYVEKTAPIASKEIFPWLTADKYRFWMIGQSNLDKLKTLGNTEAYLEFMRKQFPGKF
jgi:tetratricopeptide (TPR) repeat protein